MKFVLYYFKLYFLIGFTFIFVFCNNSDDIIQIDRISNANSDLLIQTTEAKFRYKDISFKGRANTCIDGNSKIITINISASDADLILNKYRTTDFYLSYPLTEGKNAFWNNDNHILIINDPIKNIAVLTVYL